MSAVEWLALLAIAVAAALGFWELVAWVAKIRDRAWERRHLQRYHQTRRRR